MLGNTNISKNADVTNKLQSINGVVIKLYSNMWVSSTAYPGYYEQTIQAKSVTTQRPDVCIFPESTALPTDLEKTAYLLLQELAGDTITNKLSFLVKTVPVSNFCVHVKGVVIHGTYEEISASILQLRIDDFENKYNQLSYLTIAATDWVADVVDTRYPWACTKTVIGMGAKAVLTHISVSGGLTTVLEDTENGYVAKFSADDATNILKLYAKTKPTGTLKYLIEGITI